MENIPDNIPENTLQMFIGIHAWQPVGSIFEGYEPLKLRISNDSLRVPFRSDVYGFFGRQELLDYYVRWRVSVLASETNNYRARYNSDLLHESGALAKVAEIAGLEYEYTRITRRFRNSVCGGGVFGDNWELVGETDLFDMKKEQEHGKILRDAIDRNIHYSINLEMRW